MVWTCRAQHRLDCSSTQAECGCTEKIWQAKEIMGWSAGEWQKEARYGFCWPSEPFWVERTPSRKTCQKAQPSVEENRALKWIWWWWWWWWWWLNRLPIWNLQNCSMFPLAFVAGWLQGHWWGFISRNYVVWPTFLLMNVFIALKGSHFWFLSDSQCLSPLRPSSQNLRVRYEIVPLNVKF